MVNTVQNSKVTTNTGLRIGHLNVYHLPSKTHDVCLLLNDSSSIHLLGLGETRLDTRCTNEALSIPNYYFIRRDASCYGETGLGIYIHHSISHCTKQRYDLEPDNVECIWLQVKPSTSASFLVGHLYKNPAMIFIWYDNFMQLMDNVYKNKQNVVLLGDFNIDLLKWHPSWDSATTLFGLQQLVHSLTRITKSSSSLLDHIYTNNNDMISIVLVSNKSIGDHCPIIRTWRCKLPKQQNKGHTKIQYH